LLSGITPLGMMVNHLSITIGFIFVRQISSSQISDYRLSLTKLGDKIIFERQFFLVFQQILLLDKADC